MAQLKKIAVIGAGYWGKNLVRNFFELGCLSAICDKKQEVLDEYRRRFPEVKTAAYLRDIFEDKNISAVVIAVPAAHHYQLTKEALLCNKHVFVEKPLALKVNEGEELVNLAEKHKRVLMVGHILQYHNAVIKLKELVERGDLGKIQYIYSSRLNIGKIRSEENILWSFAPHDISTILMILEEFPQSVYTSAGTYLQRNIPDVTLTTMNFLSGVKAHIFVSWLHPFKEQKLIVVGSKKMAVFDDMSKEKLFLYPHRVEWIDRVPVASRAETEIISFEMEEPLRNECKHFLECIDKGLIPKTDGNEGLKVLRILDASQGSLNSEKTVHFSSAKADVKSFFVHESAIVDEDVVVGEGTKIWHFSHILKGSFIGKNCKIGQNVVVGPNAVIGNNCKIQNNVSVYTGITLEDEVFCGPSCVFTNVFNPRSAISRMDEVRKTLIKHSATIGANATIVCGCTIGRYAFIGAGAVVTRDVPDYALVYGNPAVLKGWMCECGVKLDSKNTEGIKCLSCGKKYTLDNRKIVLEIDNLAGER